MKTSIFVKSRYRSTFTMYVMLAVLLPALIASSSVDAQTIFWTNTSGGLYDDGSNWSLGNIPGSNDVVIFPMPGEYDIEFLTPRFVEELRIESDAKPSFTIAGHQHEDRYLSVDTDLKLSNEGMLRLVGGSGPGRFHLLVDDAVAVDGNSFDPVSGTLSVENSSYLKSKSGFIGQFTGSFGSALITGDNSEWEVQNHFWIGVHGDGELRIEAGGIVNGAHDNAVALHDHTKGEVYIDGVGSDGQPSSWVSPNRLLLGSSGEALLSITGGAFASHQDVAPAYYEDSRADVLVSGTDLAGNPSTWMTGELEIYTGFGGELDLNVVDGGLVQSETAKLIGVGSPSVHLQGVGPDGQPSTWIVNTDLHVGFGSYTEVMINNGAHLNSQLATISRDPFNSAYITLGVDPGLEVTSSWINSGDVFLGGHESSAAGPAGLELNNRARVEIGGTLTIWDQANVYAYQSFLAATRIDNTHGGSFDMREGSEIQFNRYDGNLLHDEGLLSPGLGAVPSTIIGDYTQLQAATTRFEIGGPAGMHDALSVVGLADMNGAIEVELVDGFVPTSSDTFNVFAATTMIGLLNNVANGQRLDLVDGNGSFVVNYGLSSPFGSNQIVLSDFEGSGFVLGDVNGDGAVNLLDVQPFVEILASGSFQAEADINQDGAVDLLDVEPFVDLLSS